MSDVSSESLAKIRELKKWQQAKQNELNDQQFDNKFCRPSDTSPRLINTNDSTSSFKTPLQFSDNDKLIGENNIEKRPFLRRGEGLRSRFRVHPDTFNLKNLPKYKYTKGTSNQSSTLKQTAKKSFEKEVSTEKEDDPEASIPAINQTDYLAWANVLDPRNVEPLSLRESRSNSIDTSNQELDIFELLEQKIDNSSFCSNSSSILRLIGQQVTKRLRPNDPILDRESIDDLVFALKPVPEDTQLLYSSSESDGEEKDDVRTQAHVRFNDDVEVNEIESSEESDTETMMQDTSEKHSDEDGCSEKTLAEIIQNFVESKEKDLFEKNELLKHRLKELESEIANFHQQNQILTKMMQEQELKKLELEEHVISTRRKIGDEKSRFEQYLQDERKKLTEEKTKMEKRLSQPSRKEREETGKLREELAKLQEEYKSRENRHSSAMARMRSQIRNHEKTIRDKDLEIEAARKEHKKLESENIRLRRLNNNKMLSEINKNIAKLTTTNEAPKACVSPPPVEVPVTIRKQLSSSDSSEDEDTSQDDEETAQQSHRPSENKGQSTSAVHNLKREIDNLDGSKDIWYPNGSIKKISPDGLHIKMLYFNKDIKETNMNEGTVKYYYATTNTWHTTYLDGLEILEYPNGQIEHRFKDGTVELHFPNGAVRYTSPTDNPEIKEEWKYPDGTAIKILANGQKIILLPNGEKEIHTNDQKRREFPDGTVKIVFSDGSQETRYSNGRVRLRDKSGKLVMDSEQQI